MSARKFERLWLGVLIVAAAVYAYYFLILPQSWTLCNDYLWLLEQPQHHEPFWRHAWNFTQSEMLTGRFHPVWEQWTMFWYHHIPLLPVNFRIIQFFLLTVSCTLIALILKELRLTSAQILFALALFLTNFTVKDWITLTAALEPLATTFFLGSLFALLRGKRPLATTLFSLSFLSKESYFVLCPSLILLDYRGLGWPRRISWRTVFCFVLPCFAFALFVHGLQRIYTAHVFSHFGVIEVLRGLFLPPIRNFGPVLLLVGYTFWRNKPLNSEESTPIALGLIIIVTLSVFLAAWGPYDSWLYLHIAIPVGWAFVLASLWRPDTSKVGVGLAGLSSAFLAFSVIHGSRNVWNFITDAKAAAAVACQDYEHNPNLTIYSNCNEGSIELKNYLLAYHVCKNPPNLLWTESNPKLAQPFEIVYSKRCDSLTVDSGSSVRARFPMWTIYASDVGPK